MNEHQTNGFAVNGNCNGHYHYTHVDSNGYNGKVVNGHTGDGVNGNGYNGNGHHDDEVDGPLTNGKSAPKMATLHKLLQPVQPKVEDCSTKVTVVGVGQVGMACVFSLLTQNVSNNIAMVDMCEERLAGELMDLQHGSTFLNNPTLAASTDYSITAGSRLCIVTAGVRQKEGESRLNLLQRNTDVLKQIIPQLLKYSPNTIFLIATNPCDIMTYVTWRISGLPAHRVIGSGTNLDSARFRFLLAERLGIAPSSCNGYIIGEHGDSSVALWSGVNVAGVRLAELNAALGAAADGEGWRGVHGAVVRGADRVIAAKGYTSWAIGLSLAELARALLANTGSVHPVTTNIKGQYGVTEDVFLSLPCSLAARGVRDVVRVPLAHAERAALLASAENMLRLQKGIQF